MLHARLMLITLIFYDLMFLFLVLCLLCLCQTFRPAMCYNVLSEQCNLLHACVRYSYANVHDIFLGKNTGELLTVLDRAENAARKAVGSMISTRCECWPGGFDEALSSRSSLYEVGNSPCFLWKIGRDLLEH